MKRFTETPTSRPLRRRSSLTAVSLLLGTALFGACAGQARDFDSEDYVAGVAITSQFGELPTGAREVALERLEVQLEYLLNEIAGINEMTEELVEVWEEARNRGGAFPPDVPDRVPAQWISRRKLLDELYVQRLRTFELLRMDVETERQLGS